MSAGSGVSGLPPWIAISIEETACQRLENAVYTGEWILPPHANDELNEGNADGPRPWKRTPDSDCSSEERRLHVVASRFDGSAPGRMRIARLRPFPIRLDFELRFTSATTLPVALRVNCRRAAGIGGSVFAGEAATTGKV